MSLKPCFVDTVCWVALLNKGDNLHDQVTQVYGEQFRAGRRLVTTTAVLNETANALSAPRFRLSVVAFYRRLQQSRRVEIVWVDDELWARGWQLFSDRLDKEWSLTDCISISVCADRSISDALTTDHHFKQAGLNYLLALR